MIIFYFTHSINMAISNARVISTLMVICTLMAVSNLMLIMSLINYKQIIIISTAQLTEVGLL